MKFVSGTASDRYDVVVVGSGAGALTAAATAARAGKSVVVLEKSALLGGTSAVSGGMLWVADNHHAREAGITDSKEAAAKYVRAVARGRDGRSSLDAALDYGDQMLRFVEEECGVRFIFLNNFPDYRQDLPGAVEGGRTVEPELFNSKEALGALTRHVRTDGRAPFTMQEYELGCLHQVPVGRPEPAPGATASWPRARPSSPCSWRAWSATARALVTGARGHRLVTDGGRVTGVELETGDVFQANDGVVLATGGFEWDKALADSMLASRLYTMCSPPSNTGDGLRMAQRIGGQTRGTREAWWAPMSVTGDTRDGQPIGTLLRFERQGPGSLMVNRHGRRFANESQNYNDLARSLQSWDSARNQTLNTPRACDRGPHLHAALRHFGAPGRPAHPRLPDRGADAGRARGENRRSRRKPDGDGGAVQRVRRQGRRS